MYKNLRLILQFSYLRGPSNHHCGSLTVVKLQICAQFYIYFIRLENKIPQNSSVILCHASSRFQWPYGCTTTFPWYSTWDTEEIIICRGAFPSLQIQVKLTTWNRLDFSKCDKKLLTPESIQTVRGHSKNTDTSMHLQHEGTSKIMNYIGLQKV
jgi:hypothetical protein